MSGYISHEFNEGMHDIKKRLDKYLEDNDTEWWDGFWMAFNQHKVEYFSCE